jgi:hypothetical protein
MKKTTESQILQMLREAARRRYGEVYARRLLPALRETARAVLETRNRPPGMEDQPAFFVQPTRVRKDGSRLPGR